MLRRVWRNPDPIARRGREIERPGQDAPDIPRRLRRFDPVKDLHAPCPDLPQFRECLRPGITGRPVHPIDQGAVKTGLSDSPFKIGEHDESTVLAPAELPVRGTAGYVTVIEPVDPHRPPPIAPGLSSLATRAVGIRFTAGLRTVDQAAQRLRVSRWTVYNLIRSGQLRTVKIGRRRLVTPAALAECVDSLGEVA